MFIIFAETTSVNALKALIAGRSPLPPEDGRQVMAWILGNTLTPALSRPQGEGIVVQNMEDRLWLWMLKQDGRLYMGFAADVVAESILHYADWFNDPLFPALV
jgi:hypothetical protein